MKKSFLVFALMIGVILRLVWLDDMEYKTDEEYLYLQLQNVGDTKSFSWTGMMSGVKISNPGMSVWVFLALGKLFRVSTPTELAASVALLNILALAGLAFFIFRFIGQKEQNAWIAGLALACVNPFSVMYQRKIWAQSVLPFFTFLFLLSWWNKEKKWGAFLTGLLAACLGQIHMSGFFFSLGFLLWTFLFDRKNVRWAWALSGALLGSLTLLPWLAYIFQTPNEAPIIFGLPEIVQLKFWVFWLTNPLGLQLGHTLGIHLGNFWWQQLQDFLRYPVLFGTPSYFVGILHAILLVLGVMIYSRGVFKFSKNFRFKPDHSSFFTLHHSKTNFVLSAVLIGYGTLLTLSGVLIHRYYLLIITPLEFVWLSKLALLDSKRGQKLLMLLFFTELFLSISFLGYIHQHHGSPNGDYGVSYKYLKKLKKEPKHESVQ